MRGEEVCGVEGVGEEGGIIVDLVFIACACDVEVDAQERCVRVFQYVVVDKVRVRDGDEPEI